MSHVLAAEQAVEKALADVAADVPRAAEALAAAQTEFEAVGGYEADKRISNVLSGLGFKQQDFHALASSFSGGWQMRIALARTLLSPAGDAARGAGRAPGLLMLDEPTNHLDNAACAWLADFLSSSGGTVLLVSHDETLLECVPPKRISRPACACTWNLARHADIALTRYSLCDSQDVHAHCGSARRQAAPLYGLLHGLFGCAHAA